MLKLTIRESFAIPIIYLIMYEPSMFFTDESGPGSDSGGGGNPVFGEESMPEDVRLLGSSEVGYSEIYRAKIDGKFVVLKSLKPELRGISMYEHLLHKEYEIGYDLDHPNICQIQRFGKFIGLGNCIVMQWIDGVTLRSMLGHMDAGQRGKLSTVSVMRWSIYTASRLFIATSSLKILLSRITARMSS